MVEIDEEMRTKVLKKVVELYKDIVEMSEKIADMTKREKVSDFMLILNTVLLDVIDELINLNLEYQKFANEKAEELIKQKKEVG